MALLSRFRRSTLVAAALLLLVGATALAYTYRDTLGLADPPRDEHVENLRAFAKLYGYVRYFHPSDAAVNTEWDKFAIHGVRQVKDASSRGSCARRWTRSSRRLRRPCSCIAPAASRPHPLTSLCRRIRQG
jgi:hypothetical protein